MTKEEGLKELRLIIEKDIKHIDYDRVTKLADEYYKLTTGDDITDLLSQILARELDEEYAQRKRLTNSIVPPVLGSTKLPYQKVVRKKPLIRTIDWETGDVETKKQELEKYIDTYWGDAGLEKYLEYAAVDYNYLDPNAFLITEFKPFDAKKEKAKPYPFVATSDQAIMFEFHNNILQYLVVRLPIKYLDGDIERDGYKFTMYLGYDTIQLTQVARGGIEIKDKFYELQYFQPKAKKVPARRLGYKRDPQTKGRTFVAAYEDIKPFLKKILKSDSELDLTTALTAFPQRFAYVSPCKNEGCKKGQMLDGKMCPVCDGTGQEPFHKSVMDVVTLDLPRDPLQIINLDQLMTYKYPPIELLTFQEEYIKSLTAQAYYLMFNKELLSRNEVAATATEKVLETDNMNDTLNPFAQSLSTLWEHVVEDIATFTDLGDGIILHHQYPSDFKFKSLTELMSELKAAKDAGAATSTIAAIEDDINELLYSDRPDELKAMRIKNGVNPFRGYSEENVRLLIAHNKTTEYNAILWANLEAIFNELENENQNPWIYDMSFDKILSLVAAKTNEYVEKMKAEAPVPFNPFSDVAE
jgi:hypothetical protein